jgi:hypothetical protein
LKWEAGPVKKGKASRKRIYADILAFDREGHPVLLVEAKAMLGADAIAKDWLIQLMSYLRSDGTDIPFGMLVDLEEIQIFQSQADDPSTPILKLRTAEVLKAYDAEFEHKRIFDIYLAALVEAWLRDFAFDWRSATPPAMEELSEIGLAQRLKGGTTRREVVLAGGVSLY